MARWVSGDSAGHICFFDCSAGSRVVHPYLPRGNNSSSSSNDNNNNNESGSNSNSYYQRLLQSQCSCLTFSGGWGGYDETEVTMGTSEGGIFAVSSQWPSAAAAAAAAAASSSSSSSSSSNYFDFPQTEGEAEVLRCASLPYCVLLVQMLGVHTPELRRLMLCSEAATAGAAESGYPGLGDAICCRGLSCDRSSSSSSSGCSCHTRSSDLFGTDRQLLAVDKGGNGVVLDWCSSRSTSSMCEATELRGFSLREPLCCCCSNSLLLQQLAVASATAASFLSVYDIEANAFCFYAHAPPATAAAQTILRCSSSSSSQLISNSNPCDGAPPAGGICSSTTTNGTRLPVYAELSSPWPRRPSDVAAAGAAINSNNSSKLQQQVCTSVSWLPRLGPSVLCGVTADALLLLYDTRASSFPVYIASTAARNPSGDSGGAPGAPKGAPQRAGGGPRPMVFVGAQPGLVAAQDEMEAAVLPCCCCCCCCTGCKRQRSGQQQQQQQQVEQQQQQQVEQHAWQQSSLFEDHRGLLVLKPHATGRCKRGSSSKSNSLRLLSGKLQARIAEDFEGLAAAHCQHEALSKLRRVTGSNAAAAAAAAAVIPSTAKGAAGDVAGAAAAGRRGAHKRRIDSWGAALVAMSSSSDSPLTSFPAVSAAAAAAAAAEKQQQQEQHAGLRPEVLGWLTTACYTLVATSLSRLLTEKHIVRRRLLQHTQQQLLLLLRSSCLPPELLQPSPAASNGKNRSSSSSDCCSLDPAALTAGTAATRPLKKARNKSSSAAAAAAKGVGRAACSANEPAAAAAPPPPLEKHQSVLQQFADRVQRLLRVVDFTDSSSTASDVRQQQQQIQQLLPLLFQRQQQNVLRLLEYCAAFSFCFSQSFLRACKTTFKASSLSQPADAAAPAAPAADMQQSELPALLLHPAAKEVLRWFKRSAPVPGSSAAVISAARDFVGSLQVGFGFAAQQPHLLFSVLLCWRQQQLQQQEWSILRPLCWQPDTSNPAEENDSPSSKIEQQQETAAGVEVPEVYIQRNCICKLPISDSLFFSIAEQQRSKRGSKKRHRSSSNCGDGRSRTSSSGPAVDTAQLICCDIAGEISVLRVSVLRFRNHSEKQQYIHCTAATTAAAESKNSSHVQQHPAEDALAKARIWFPQLPAFNQNEEAAAEETPEKTIAASGPSLALGRTCCCRCCVISYSVHLDMNFVAPRSSSSSSSLSVHSNGSYLLLASRDPYFALYGINPHLPPYGSRSRIRVPPLLGLALPPVAAAPLQQHQHAAADVMQPVLLSAAPLLPSVPLPTSLPPYLAAPPILPTQVSLQHRFQQQQLQQQQAATPATPANLGGAAWDTGIEFSDWLTEPEDPDWQQSDGE